jgi:hypothetical protein
VRGASANVAAPPLTSASGTRHRPYLNKEVSPGGKASHLRAGSPVADDFKSGNSRLK